HHQRRTVGEHRRRRQLDLHRPPPAGNLLSRTRPPGPGSRQPMNVLIPTPLLDYTRQSPVAAHNATLAEVLADLDARYPGIRFRMVDEQDRLRPHVRFFVNGRAVHELTHTLTETDELAIVQALSGG